MPTSSAFWLVRTSLTVFRIPQTLEHGSTSSKPHSSPLNILYSQDACNRKSNQQNLGTIKCSNLCTEIIEYTSPEETAVCNLASIALPRFVREKSATAGWESKKLIGSLDWENR